MVQVIIGSLHKFICFEESCVRKLNCRGGSWQTPSSIHPKGSYKVMLFTDCFKVSTAAWSTCMCMQVLVCFWGFKVHFILIIATICPGSTDLCAYLTFMLYYYSLLCTAGIQLTQLKKVPCLGFCCIVRKETQAPLQDACSALKEMGKKK